MKDLRSKRLDRKLKGTSCTKANTNWDCASYLSPLGKALLLKNVNDKVEIDTAGGELVYRIKSIELV